MNNITNCPYCDKSIPVDSRFCQYCGKDLESVDSQNKTNLQNQANILLREELQKREVLAEAEEKKKSSTKKIATIAVIMVVLVIIAFCIKDGIYNAQPRNIATETMNKNFTNVYADVTAIKPAYYIYQYKKSRSGLILGDGDLWEIVCRCTTVEGKSIWASFFYQRYPDGNYSKNEKDYEIKYYRKDNPLHLVGKMNTARQVSKELEEVIGDNLVLYVNTTSQH